MLNPGYKSRAARTSAAGTSDTEALQTDVMRFIAIIGLCLTAVFSLMRSIADPTTNQLPDSRVTNRPEQLASLQQELTHRERAEQQLRQQLQNQQTQLEQLIRLQQTTHQQYREQQARLVQALDDQQQQYKTLQRESSGPSEKQVGQSSNRQQRKDESTASSDTVGVSLPEPVVAVVSTAEKAASPPVVMAEKKPEKKGFVLKFASKHSLSKLLETRRVRLLAMTGEQAWQLHPDGTAITFNPVAIPQKYHEMLPNTLPPNYRQRFYTEVNATPGGEPVWAVLLQPATQQQIQQLLQQNNGGELTIQSDGSVRLQTGDSR